MLAGTDGFSFKAGNALAYQASRWEGLLWDGRKNADGVVGSVQQVAAPLRAAAMKGMKGTSEAERLENITQAEGDAATFGLEVFSRLYGDPSKVEAPKKWAEAAHDVIGELPEWQALREAVAGDPDFSALAAQKVLEAVGPKLKKLLDQVEKEEEAGGGGAPGGSRSEQLGAAGQQLRAALRGACETAQQVVADGKEALEGIAPGLGSAPATHGQQDPKRMELAQLLLVQPRLRDILRKAGKLVRMAERKLSAKSPQGADVVVGLEVGAELPRVLPSALAGLLHPVLKTLVLKGIAERTLPQYRMEGKIPQGAGPVVILVDESGSMQGDGERWAKAAVLACISLAAKQGREVAIVMFNGGISAAWDVSPDGRTFALSHASPKDGRRTPAGDRGSLALDLCRRYASGGTNFDRPMVWGLDYLESRNPKADLLFVTDGMASVGEITMQRIQKAKEAGLRIYGLTVNGGSVSSAVDALCTSVVDIDRDGEERISGALPTRR